MYPLTAELQRVRGSGKQPWEACESAGAGGEEVHVL